MSATWSTTFNSDGGGVPYMLFEPLPAADPNTSSPAPELRFNSEQVLLLTCNGSEGPAVIVSVWAYDEKLNTWTILAYKLGVSVGFPSVISTPEASPIYVQLIAGYGNPTGLCAYATAAMHPRAAIAPPLPYKNAGGANGVTVRSIACRVDRIAVHNSSAVPMWAHVYDSVSVGTTDYLAAFPVPAGGDYQTPAGYELACGTGLVISMSTTQLTHTDPAGGNANKCTFEANVRHGLA